jgi:hypothetical protein
MKNRPRSAALGRAPAAAVIVLVSLFAVSPQPAHALDADDLDGLTLSSHDLYSPLERG